MTNQPAVADDGAGYAQAREAADVIAAATPLAPRIVIVLGSGLGDLAERVEGAVVLPFATIPHLAQTTVPGHAGQLVVGTLAGAPVAILRGRLHLYEGHSPQEITFPLRVLGLLGAQVCILTNAAGGINPALTAGALMLIRDHISFPTLAGHSPLFGANDDRYGPRFPSMMDAYDLVLRQMALNAAQERGIALTEGVYAMVAGPSFETTAELQMLRLLGADAVGMSTALEAIVARHMGMRVLALSIITNETLADANEQGEPTHEEVLRAAAAVTGQVTALISDVIAQLP